MAANEKAYAALIVKAAEIGWPRLWFEDLTRWDAMTLLAEEAPQEFCWSVRETGTWLYRGRCGELWHLLYWELFCLPGRNRFFHWTGEHLVKYTFPQAMLLVETLERQLVNWAKLRRKFG